MKFEVLCISYEDNFVTLKYSLLWYIYWNLICLHLIFIVLGLEYK